MTRVSPPMAPQEADSRVPPLPRAEPDSCVQRGASSQRQRVGPGAGRAPPTLHAQADLGGGAGVAGGVGGQAGGTPAPPPASSSCRNTEAGGQSLPGRPSPAAMALPAPLALLAALALCWAHGERPTVRLLDQGGPMLEGSYVTMECLTDEDGADMSQFTFQKYSRWLQSWVSLDRPGRLRCWFFDVNVTRAQGRLLLAIEALQSWHAGAYRCLAANATGNASASAEIRLRVEYLRSVSVTRAHAWCGTVGDSLAVMEGEDLELQCSADASQPPEYEWSRQGDDWVVASSSLSLPQVSREQAGTYVCRARHPGLPHLASSRAVRLDVQGAQSSYRLEPGLGLSTPMLLLAVGLPALLLLLLVLGLGAFVLRHRGAPKVPAGEEPGQRTPIYKGSLESVPSAVGDQQPLVL